MNGFAESAVTINRERVFAWHPRREQWYRIVFGAGRPKRAVETSAKKIEEGDTTILLPWMCGLKDVQTEARQ